MTKLGFNDGRTDVDGFTLGPEDGSLVSKLGFNDGSTDVDGSTLGPEDRSEEHTSELQSPIVTSYAFFCLIKKISEGHARARAGT